MLQILRFDIKGECHMSVIGILALGAQYQSGGRLSQKVLPLTDFKIYLQPLLLR
jgi:hypothetical protein